MRLLNTSTLRVEDFVGSEVPEYVILSHTWEEEEVTLQDIESGTTALQKKGYQKIKDCCRKASSDGFLYCWIDTCCIDKKSSAELSEAINSMYQWYRRSRICYAYLSDFDDSSDSVIESYRNFSRCKWWGRGWTLQELIAPTIVEFYSAKWTEIGTKLSLQEQITEITGVDEGVLSGVDPRVRNVAVRMSWAAHRATSRIEDRAYCLMGLFGVNMPLLYGEGHDAFIRLQEEIMRVCEDYTLFAWSPNRSPLPGYTDYSYSHISKGPLAQSPSDFIDSKDRRTVKAINRSVVSWSFGDLSTNCSSLMSPPNDHEPPFLTSRGVRVSLPMSEQKSGLFYACLTLSNTSNKTQYMVCISLHRLPTSGCYIRPLGTDVALLPTSWGKSFRYRSIYIMRPPPRKEIPRMISGVENNGMPSLVIVQPTLTRNQSLSCFLSSWISMEKLLSARFGAIHPSEPPSSPNPSINRSTTSSSFAESGSLYTYRLNKLIHAPARLYSLISATNKLQYKEMISLAMDNPLELCWFSDVGASHMSRSTGARGVLGFGDEQHSNSAFLVNLGLFEEKPLCNVVPTTMEDLQDDHKHKTWLEDTTNSPLHRDRVSFHLNTKFVDKSTSPADSEIIVSIRRIASASCGIRRYILSITQKTIVPTTTYRDIVKRGIMNRKISK